MKVLALLSYLSAYYTSFRINENPSDWLWSHDQWKYTYEEASLWNQKK